MSSSPACATAAATAAETVATAASSSARACRASASMSDSVRRAPSAANRRAVAAPMLPAAPEMNAVLSSSRPTETFRRLSWTLYDQPDRHRRRGRRRRRLARLHLLLAEAPYDIALVDGRSGMA